MANSSSSADGMGSSSSAYYSYFYFGGKKVDDIRLKYNNNEEVNNSLDDGDDIMFGKDRRPSLLSRNLRPDAKPDESGAVGTERSNSLTVKDMPPFKKSMKCCIEGCKKTFTFGGRSHCRRCGNSCCNKHVSSKKVPMDLFGYATPDGDRMFEKVCVKCYDEAMDKSFQCGELSAGRLLCYLRLFRDRTRYLRIKRGLKAIRTLQAILRGDRTRIELTWTDRGHFEEEEIEKNEGGAAGASYQNTSRERNIPVATFDSIKLSRSEDRQDSIPREIEQGLRSSMDGHGDDVPHPNDSAHPSISTNVVNQKFMLKPVLSSQKSPARRSSMKIVRSKKKKQEEKQEQEQEQEQYDSAETASNPPSTAPTPEPMSDPKPEHALAPRTGTSAAMAIPGAANEGEVLPPGRVRGASLTNSLYAKLTLEDESPRYGTGTSIEKNKALSEAQEILQKQKERRFSVSSSYERKPSFGLMSTIGGNGSMCSMNNMNNSSTNLASQSSNPNLDGMIAMSPATLITLGTSPAGVSALREYMRGGNEVEISVTSPNSRQYKTDEENAAEREDIETLIDLKKEAQQRAQHQKYVKKLEEQAKAEADARRLAVKEARAKRLEAEERALSDSTHGVKPTPQVGGTSRNFVGELQNTGVQRPTPSREYDKRFDVSNLRKEGETATEAFRTARNDSADAEEEKERARLAEAERRRQAALDKLPVRPVVPPSTTSLISTSSTNTTTSTSSTGIGNDDDPTSDTSAPNAPRSMLTLENPDNSPE